MLENIIKYYKRITTMALVNLKNEKSFQFRKHLTNHSLLKATEDYYEKIHKSPEAKKLIKEYTNAMNSMYKNAKIQYNDTLNKLKSTNDEILKQKILNDYADKGIHGFTSKDGKHWNIETYSNMYSRHINNELIRLSVIETVSNNLVKVSSHGTICDECKPYEGKILTLEELANARSNGLFHVNCLHFVVHVVRRLTND